jgi:DNA topoisomerase-1
MKLLIVESPGKLKTLRKILGPEWKLEASVGHTTELAHDGYKNLGFDFDQGKILTRYIPRGSRGSQVLKKLRAASKEADTIYLAMDPDREGEAIAWHLVEQLRLKRFVRISYTQITDSAVKAAIAKPRPLDLPLIHAQRARQCLDKLVGYEVSPLLWNSSGGKSAGRVQSATLHLVCERERERLAFKPEDYWALFSTYAGGLTAQFEPKLPQGAKPEDKRVKTAAHAARIRETALANPHVVAGAESREEKRFPPPPFITSSLQQAASARLKLSPQKTMQVAQSLYEAGHITYMRTDAVTLSPEFVNDARTWLSANAPAAMAASPPSFRVKAEAQGAHEAIRPSHAEFTPSRAAEKLPADQAGLYRLIWERALASQCKPATLARGQIEILSGDTRWIARGLTVLDRGYLDFWYNIDQESALPRVTAGEALQLSGIKVEAKNTQPPSRYSEAKLIELMEKLGIGRPSTYASTVITLKDRDYVVLNGGTLAPTSLGLKTDEVLMIAIPEIVDVKFTADMETSLDRIAEGKVGWEAFLSGWNSDYFSGALEKARVALSAMPKVPFQRGKGGFNKKRGARGGKRRYSAKGKRKKAAVA